MNKEEKYKDIKLYPNEELTIKCLRDNLNKYMSDENAHVLIEQIDDYFILDHIRFIQTKERVKKQINKQEDKKNE